MSNTDQSITYQTACDVVVESSRQFAAPDVVAVDALATKHRCDFEGEGVAMSGLRIRKRLIQRLASWEDLGFGFQMWTLTYDPWPYVPGGQPAGWDDWEEEDKREFYKGEEFQLGCMRCDVHRKHDRDVGECMKSLRACIGAFQWVSFLEYQDNGLPHLHILILQPGQVRIPFVLMHQAWGKGGVRFSKDKRGRVRGSGHAARYATFYGVKGFRMPAWMSDDVVPRYLRFVSCSRGFWGQAAGVRDAEPAKHATPRPSDATWGEIRRCPGRWHKVMMRFILSTGELVYRHVNMDMATCVSIMGKHGFFGGYDEGALKQRRGNMSFLGKGRWDQIEPTLLLDYLSHCGIEGDGHRGAPAALT